MTKIKQYLQENAYSLVAIFTANFALCEFWEFWLKSPLGLKATMTIIYVAYIWGLSELDSLSLAIKSKDKMIHAQAAQIDKLNSRY
ncbi:hypothetical protein [Weissella viridescens]|uniref:hypothetical protein n=1 Tax=Weissella viridescens TaxID=1629 RepID=UPI003AF2B43C